MDAFKSLANKFGSDEKKDDKIDEHKTEGNKNDNENQPLKEQAEKQTEQRDKGYSVFDKLGNSFKESMNDIEEGFSNVQSDIKGAFNKLDDTLKQSLKAYQSKINKWLHKKIEGTIIELLEKLRPKIKEGAKDPDMCNCVKNFVDDVVDDVWPEIIDEIQYHMSMATQQPFIEIPHQKSYICCYPVVCFRNWYLYSVDPYDRTIWKKFKTVSWWFWTLVSAIPFYSVSQFFFVFDIILRDKSDEFQLVAFILKFKTMYFITQGVMKAIIGYFMLYACTTMMDRDDVDYSTRCTKEGPGASIQELTEILGFFLQVAFIWIIFFLLPFSKQKGKPRIKYQEDKVETGCFYRGGRIKYFMIWDAFALSASVGLFLLVFLIQKTPDFDNSGDFIYFAQICYGLLSFPFLIFNIPFIKDRLTKAKPTAYDKKGNCVPKRKGVRFDYQIEDDKFKRQHGLLDDLQVDVGEVFDG